jgi:hypothetical protein
MTARLARVLAWLVTGGLVVLGSRAIAYALAPSSLAARLSQEAGGPRLPLVAAVSLGIGLAASTAIVWLASLGVRERRLGQGPVKAVREDRQVERHRTTSSEKSREPAEWVSAPSEA